MTELKIVVCIAHAAWMPERAATLARLLEQVPSAHVLKSVRREHAATWARRAWEWVASQGEPVVILNDDVTVCPGFDEVIQAMIDAAPHRAISLHTSAPGAEELIGTAWARCYWYTGPGVLLWPEHAQSLLDYWARLPHAFGPNEDNIAIQWAWDRQQPFWNCIPAVVRHDVETKSSLGYDHHPLRSSNVDWEAYPEECLTEPDYWLSGVVEPPFIENPWATAASLEATRRGLMAKDVCGICWTRPALIRNGLIPMCPDCIARTVRAVPPRFRLFVGTPYRADGVQPDYVASILGLQRMLGLEVQHEMSLDVRHEHQDLVRVRSRMVRIAYESACTHLLFADADNAWPPEVVINMLKTGKDYVQCPYLRRDGHGYTIRPTAKDRKNGVTAPEDIQPDNTIEIEGTGLGLTLLSRACLERMLAHYGAGDLNSGGDLTYQDLDRATGKLHPTVALFQLMIRGGGLLSEDMSFAQRWRDIGGKVWLYIGQGSPIAHYGTTKFQGSIEDLGFTHTPEQAAQ